MNNAQTFSIRSDQYARHRPSYPWELLSYLSDLSPGHERAWDCATGNGQFAIKCTEFFETVYATDIGREQIRYAMPHPKINYCVSRAEDVPFDDGVFDLIVVAQAVHWFNLERFYRECLRVLRAGGIFAVLGYAFPTITPEIDRLIGERLLKPVDRFWAEGNRLIMNAYRTLPFPLAEIPNVPDFAIKVTWNLTQFLAYLRTWSAVKRYLAEIGEDPIALLSPALEEAWGAPEQNRTVAMPLALKVGRVDF